MYSVLICRALFLIMKNNLLVNSVVVEVATAQGVASSNQTIWDRCCFFLRGELDPQVYDAFIRPLVLVSFGGGTAGNGSAIAGSAVAGGELVLGAPTRLVCTHVDRHFKERILSVLTRKMQLAGVSLRLVVSNQVDVRVAEPIVPAPIPFAAQTRSDLSLGQQIPDITEINVVQSEQALGTGLEPAPITLAPMVVKKIRPLVKEGASNRERLLRAQGSHLSRRYTFNSFVVGNSNQFCHAAAMRVAESPGQSYNPLFIYGGVGLGKTHLLHAIGNQVLQANGSAKILYLSSETFTNELIQALKGGRMNEFKNKFRGIDLLLIDDIQFLCGKERTQEEFFHTFNALYSAKHQIVITSDKLPQEIPGIEERLQTRFSWGLIADLQAPDFETRVAILKKKAAVDGISLPEDVAHFVAERVSSNVRELEGALTRLTAIGSLQGLPLSLGSAQTALKHLYQPKAINVSVTDIKKIVSEHFGIKVADMVSKRRTKNLSFPRHIAMYLSRKHTTCSYPEIGSNFGGRDHSSVIHAANVVTAKISSDNEIKSLITLIERKLNQHGL